jgi:prepilin-type N-terminal cleavage/methylation domain-containing protein
MFISAGKKTNQTGFTLIELMIVLGLVATLFALSSVSLGRQMEVASLATTAEQLTADIKNQQMLAMSGAQGSSGEPQSRGLYIQPEKYVLFSGEAYDPDDDSNFSISNGQGVELSTDLPGSQLVFRTGDGQAEGFSQTEYTITLSNSDGSKVISINRLGAVEIE